MKKFVLIIAILFICVGCSKDNISYKDLLNKMDNKESFVLYVEDSEKSIMKTTLDNVKLEYPNINVYSFNPSKLSQDEINELKLRVDYDTPCIVFIIDGVDPSRDSHVTNKYITKKELITRLTNMNFIKEEKNAE